MRAELLLHYWVLAVIHGTFRQAAGAADGIHIAEFRALCRLMNLAKGLAGIREEGLPQSLPGWNYLKQSRAKIEELALGLNESSNGISEKVIEGGVIKIPGGPLARLVHVRLHHLASKIGMLQGKLERESPKVVSSLQQAKKDALQALGGTLVENVPDASAVAGWYARSPARGTMCVNGAGPKCESGATRSGCSLIGDIMCICAKTSSDSGASGKECGIDVSGHDWNGGTFSGANTAWGILDTGCASLNLVSGEPKVKDVQEAIKAFEALIGAGKDDTATGGGEQKALWVLGQRKGSAACDGTNTNGICVSYAKNGCSGTACARGSLDWLDKLIQAAAGLGELERLRHESEEMKGQADSILLTAESILVEANASDASGRAPAGGRIEGAEKLMGAEGTTPQNPDRSATKVSAENNSKATKVNWVTLSIFMF